MKADEITGRYRKKMLDNMIKSGVIAFVAVILLLLSFNVIVAAMRASGFAIPELAINEKTVWAYLIAGLVIGDVLFVSCFYRYHKKDLNYLERITSAMIDISDGDLSCEIEVVGDDELSVLAARINEMGKDIKEVMAKEREAEHSKNELVTNVAHDLRTPLTSIRGYLEILKKNPNLSEEDRIKYTQIAYDKTIRLHDLIEELFGFTKMSYGKVSAKPAKLDLFALLEQLCDEFYPIFEKEEIEFTFESDTEAIPMMGDGMLLARLFANLLNNAVKYGKDGKMIRLEVSYREPLIVVKVINYGEVIPPETLEKLFDKFFRVENSRSTQTGGTGLGLAIAKNIVELHGGQIGVTSDLNGTCFCVRLRSDHDFDKEEFVGVDDV